MKILDSIKNAVRGMIKEGQSQSYLAPNIEDKKLNNAVKTIAKGVNPNYIIGIVDTTIFGSAKEGFVFLGDCLYIREPFASNVINLPYEKISTASYTIDEEINNKGKVIRTHFFEVGMADDQTIKFSPSFISSINGEALKVFFDKVIEINTSEEENIFTSEHQQKPLELFDNHIKVAYVKVLANYLLSTHEEAKPSQYAEILSFILRIKMEAEERLESIY